ncbi:MAG: hypothetical protein O6952_01650 [Planctomycetota bacterium]|nr:hypothetical protein [Planctomycetota bacterium]
MPGKEAASSGGGGISFFVVASRSGKEAASKGAEPFGFSVDSAIGFGVAGPFGLRRRLRGFLGGVTTCRGADIGLILRREPPGAVAAAGGGAEGCGGGSGASGSFGEGGDAGGAIRGCTLIAMLTKGFLSPFSHGILRW